MTLWTKCKALFHKFSFRKTKRWFGALFYCLVVVISIVGRVFLPVGGSFSVLALVWWILLWGAIEGKAYIPRKYLVRFSAHPLFLRIRRYRWDQLKGNVSQEIVIEIAACKNCGHTYVGTYCPQCGQHRATYRFTKGSIVADVFKSFFNLDRGLGATLLALLYRPGYMPVFGREASTLFSSFPTAVPIGNHLLYRYADSAACFRPRCYTNKRFIHFYIRCFCRHREGRCFILDSTNRCTLSNSRDHVESVGRAYALVEKYLGTSFFVVGAE